MNNVIPWCSDLYGLPAIFLIFIIIHTYNSETKTYAERQNFWYLMNSLQFPSLQKNYVRVTVIYRQEIKRARAHPLSLHTVCRLQVFACFDGDAVATLICFIYYPGRPLWRSRFVIKL